MSATGDATSLADRKRRAGQRLVIGFHGTEVTSELRSLVRELMPAGFILFSRNVVEPAQVLDLNRSLTELLPSDRPPLLTIDQEGGRVQRVRAPATEWPPMRRVGKTGRHTADVAEALGLELRAMGFNLDFAPVADVDSNPDNPVIGDRSFGRDPTHVADQVATFTMALQATGIMACAKHFPGHGDTNLDSHLDLPTVDRPEAELRQTELGPFAAAAAAKVASIMTAHVVFPAWDPDWPATLSPPIQRDILRGEIGYDGLLFTDDLEMKAVSDRYDVATKVRRTFLATVDLALACHEAALQLELFEEMVKQQEQSRQIDGLARHSERRLATARRDFLEGQPPAPGLEIVGSGAHLELARQVDLDSRLGSQV